MTSSIPSLPGACDEAGDLESFQACSEVYINVKFRVFISEARAKSATPLGIKFLWFFSCHDGTYHVGP